MKLKRLSTLILEEGTWVAAVTVGVGAIDGQELAEVLLGAALLDEGVLQRNKYKRKEKGKKFFEMK